MGAFECPKIVIFFEKFGRMAGNLFVEIWVLDTADMGCFHLIVICKSGSYNGWYFVFFCLLFPHKQQRQLSILICVGK